MYRGAFSSNVGRRLLVALVVAEGGELLHIQRLVQVLKAAVVQVLVASKVAANIDVHFDLRVSAVCQRVHV